MQKQEDFNKRIKVIGQRYLSPDGSFAVLEAQAVEGSELLTLRGPVGHLPVGEEAQVVGRWQTHPKFGRQVLVNSALTVDPDNTDGRVKYLESIEKIGTNRAKRLVEFYGDELFVILDADPVSALMRAIPRMGRQTARKAAANWQEKRSQRELATLLAGHGLLRLLTKLTDHYGEQALTVVRENPYLLTELHGISFRTADLIARSVEDFQDGPARTQAAVLHVLSEAETHGHTFLPLEIAEQETERLLQRGVDLNQAEQTAACVIEGDRIYRADTYRCEIAAAKRIAELIAAKPVLPEPKQLKGTAELTQEQSAAVLAAFTHRISIVTGGPGTGKSTLTKAIIDTAIGTGISTRMAAPTGRAARRLSEVTDQDASTVHRLLEWQPGYGPARDAEDPIDCRLLIVDECSMLTLRMAQLLLDAVGPTTHVVLIGDADQLPPVGAGKPFAEMIDSGQVHVTRLEHVFRQAARSLIVRAAHSINQGEEPEFSVDDELQEDVIRNLFWIERPPQQLAAEIVDLVSKRLPKHYNLDPIRDIQVLAPIYKGPAGIDNLNELLQAALNPDGEPLPIDRLRIGDKLIQTRNDYEHDLMNGQILYLRQYDRVRQTLNVLTDDGRSLNLSRTAAEDLQLAYAISVHKAQGCEVPTVVMPISRSATMLLSRNLIYTAITRAQQNCVLCGEYSVFARSLTKAESDKRYSALAQRI